MLSTSTGVGGSKNLTVTRLNDCGDDFVML